MYVWMILATFIAMLAAFNLSPRSDIQHVQNAPVAEAAIAKFLTVHDAAIKYAKAKLTINHNNPTGAIGLSAGILTGCTEAGVGDLCSFLPIGFKYTDEQYTSKVFCLNAAQYTESVNEEGKTIRTLQTQEGINNVTNCNDNGHNAIYVVSYGQIPSRWRNVATNRILPEFYYAMRNRIVVGSSCGIVSPKTVEEDERNRLDSDYVIEGINVKNNSIPLKVIEDTDFASKCLQWNEGAQSFTIPCIVYVTSL